MSHDLCPAHLLHDILWMCGIFLPGQKQDETVILQNCRKDYHAFHPDGTDVNIISLVLLCGMPPGADMTL